TNSREFVGQRSTQSPHRVQSERTMIGIGRNATVDLLDQAPNKERPVDDAKDSIVPGAYLRPRSHTEGMFVAISRVRQSRGAMRGRESPDPRGRGSGFGGARRR